MSVAAGCRGHSVSNGVGNDEVFRIWVDGASMLLDVFLDRIAMRFGGTAPLGILYLFHLLEIMTILQKENQSRLGWWKKRI